MRGGLQFVSSVLGSKLRDLQFCRLCSKSIVLKTLDQMDLKRVYYDDPLISFIQIHAFDLLFWASQRSCMGLKCSALLFQGLSLQTSF
jgi:hypothetical protein